MKEKGCIITIHPFFVSGIMHIHTFEVGPFQENTYLLTNNDEALLLDPGFYNRNEFEAFTETLSQTGAALQAILLTHAHVDHILGLHQTLKKYEVPVYLNTNDLFLWENFGSQATMFGLNQVGFSFTPEPLPSEGLFSIAGFEFECLFTPGHAPDHTAFYFSDAGICLAGDALFRESIGRTDLYEGDFTLLEQSIREKLYTLPEETVVYPGHGPTTTIAHEKESNPYVKA